MVCCPRDSQESSPTPQFDSINSSALSLFYYPALTSVHYWKNHSFDYSNVCGQSTHAKSLQSCPTLCNPMDCSPPGSSVYEIVQARILEWVVMPFSRGSFQPTGTEPVSPCSSCIPGRFFYQGSHQESFPPGNPQINYVWVLGGFSCV